MFKKQITYTDYNDVERTETFYFNLSKAEIVELETSTPGGYSGYIERLIESRNPNELIKLFKDLIRLSYGVKSDDGRKFIKNPEVLEDFMQTEAYTALFMELVSNTDSAIAFANGILPKLPAEQKAMIDAEVHKRVQQLKGADQTLTEG